MKPIIDITASGIIFINVVRIDETIVHAPSIKFLIFCICSGFFFDSNLTECPNKAAITIKEITIVPAHGVITLLGKYSQIITGSGWVSLGSFLSATLSKLKLEPAPIFKAYPIQNVTANAKACIK